jgi:hypothetical protein
MSQPVSGGDDLDENLDGSIDSNDDYPMSSTDYRKSKIFLIISFID